MKLQENNGMHTRGPKCEVSVYWEKNDMNDLRILLLYHI
jgi:hypothetical protein